MKTISCILFLLLLPLFSFSQEATSGKIIDQSNQEAILYVNIGVVGKSIGTVTDVEGNFDLTLPDSISKEIIRISTIGYKSQEYTVEEFKEFFKGKHLLSLVPESYALDQVVISSKKRKTKVLGNKTTSKSIIAGFSNNLLGNELGSKIKIKRSPTYINKFNVSIAKNNLETLQFRLNFYDIKDGLPNKILNTENIIIESNIKEGILSVDLTKYNLVVQDDFYVCLEWVEDLGEASDLMFSAGFFGKKAVVRSTSQATWEKLGTISIGFNVEVEY